jgi:hypothetical protein
VAVSQEDHVKVYNIADLAQPPARVDLFVIDAANPSTAGVTSVSGLGTVLFEVSVNPSSGRIHVPHTEAQNLVRFEHPLGVRGHMVDNRLAIVNPAAGEWRRPRGLSVGRAGVGAVG